MQQNETVQEAGSSKIADHYFAVLEEQIKSNQEIPAMLKKICEGEYTKQQVKFNSIIGEPLGEISHDDQQLLKLMDQETIKVDGHYVVPLPLVLALKRLNCLHRRFLKDNHFYEMYKLFIADIIAKGYARKADKNGKSGKTYLIMALFIQQNQ